MRTALMFAAAALLTSPAFAGPASTNQKGDNGGGRTCESGGGSGGNPGEYLRDLRDNPILNSYGASNPAEIAALENSQSDWAGFGTSQNVGAFLETFCTGGRDRS